MNNAAWGMPVGLTSDRTPSKSIMRNGNQAVVLPHQRTFSTITNWLSQTYRFRFDEALKRDYDTAKAMLNDAFIQGLLRVRTLPSAKSSWKIKATGPGASEEIEKFYEAALSQVPLWHDFRRNLLKSVWHGRYGIQFAIDSQSHDYRKFNYQGRPIKSISHWVPHNGDKITFTWDGVPCIRVNPMYVASWQQQYGVSVLQPDDPRIIREAANYRWTEEGPVIVLDKPEVRRMFAIPIFEVEDAPWDEPDLAGGVRGIGLRHYCFWTWDQRQEVVSWAMLHLEDFGAGGYTVVGYDGDEALKRNVSAFDNPETRVIHLPIIPGNDERITDMVTRLTPSGEGNDAIYQWAENYFNAHLTILLAGHPLNSQAAGTGMGSDMATKAENMLKAIQRSDTEAAIDSTMTHEVLPVIQTANDPGSKYSLEFVSTIREADKESGMKAVKAYYDMGGKVPTRHAAMLADVPDLEDGEDFLQMPNAKPAAPGLQPGTEGMEQQTTPDQQETASGAGAAIRNRGAIYADKLPSLFATRTTIGLDEARANLAAAGVPQSAIMAVMAYAVKTAAAIEIDAPEGVQYLRGPGVWDVVDNTQDTQDVLAYSTEGDPAAKWTAEQAPRKQGTRWRNNETGAIQYEQPSAGRSVQQLPGKSEKAATTIDKGQQGEDVALLPGKGIATGGVAGRLLAIHAGDIRLSGEVGVLEEVRNVDKRMLRKQTVDLAGKMGLGVNSRTSKTEALAYIEDSLRVVTKDREQNARTTIDMATKPGNDPGADGAGVPAAPAPEPGKPAPTEKPTDSPRGEKAGEKPQAETFPVKEGGKLGYDEFSSQYAEQFSKMNKYKPGEIGNDEAVEAMAKLADDHPEHLEKFESEAEAKAKGSSAPEPTPEVKQDANAPRAQGEKLHDHLQRIGRGEHLDSVRQTAKYLQRNHKEETDYHNSAIKSAAEKLSAEHGKQFRMTQAKKEGDHTTIKGFDTVAESVAHDHPGLFGGVEAGKGYSGDETGLAQDNAAKLWGMMVDGKKPYRSMEEHENLAIDQHHEAGWPGEVREQGDPRGEADDSEGGDTSLDVADEKPAEKVADSPRGEKVEHGSSGFMEQEKPGKYAAEHVEGMAGQSFTNDQGLTVDLRKEDDGTWSVGSQKGLSQAGAASHLNKIGAEPAQSLFGADVQAQGDTEKPKQKLEWSEPTKKKDSGEELPGMRDAFAPGMFGKAANAADSPRGESAEASKPSRKWKKNDDGTYTSTDGTVWKKAAHGGEESPVNGKRYVGGALMPIHGLSQKPEKKIKPGITPDTPNPDMEEMQGKGVEGRGAPKGKASPMSADDIERERQRREDGKKWSEVLQGPVGQINKRMSTEPNRRELEHGVLSLRDWKEWASSKGEDELQDIAFKLEMEHTNLIDDSFQKSKADNPTLDESNWNWAKESPSRQAEQDATMSGYTKHARELPSSLYARQLAQHYLSEKKGSIEAWHTLNKILAGGDFE